MIPLAIPAIKAALGTIEMPDLMKALGAGSGGPQGLATGLLQSIKSRKSKNAAEELQPALYDPQQVAMLNEIQQKARSINTGSAFAADMGQIDATTAGTQGAIVQAAGGDVSGTIQGLLAAQSNAGRAKNQVLGQADQQSEFYNTAAADLQNRISSRALELKMHLQNQRRAEGAQYAQDAFGNAAAGAAIADPGAIDWMDVLQTARKGSAVTQTNMEISNPFPGLNQTDTPGSGPSGIPQLGGVDAELSQVLIS